LQLYWGRAFSGFIDRIKEGGKFYLGRRSPVKEMAPSYTNGIFVHLTVIINVIVVVHNKIYVSCCER
jgi:hypothetical protein